MAWYTLVGGFTNQTDTIVELLEGPGTVRRIILDLIGGHASTGVGAVASFHWVVNVGAAATDPSVFGLDPPSTMLHGAALIPDPADFPIASQPPALSLDSDGERIMEAGESLWLRMKGGAPATGWAFVYSMRVLVT